MSSCTKENTIVEDKNFIPIQGTLEQDKNTSRVHWTEGDKKMLFHWDSSDSEMKSTVYHNGAFKQFSDNNLYSPTSIIPDEENRNNCDLKITNSLKEEYSTDDIVWAVTPISNQLKCDYNCAEVSFVLPDNYTQTDTSTNHLQNYILMSGLGNVYENENKEKTANLNFKLYPSIYRFRIKNNDSETLSISSVSLNGPFNNKATLKFDGTETIEYSRNISTENYTICVNAENINIESGKTQDLYALVFPTETSKISEKITLSYKGKYGALEVSKSTEAICNLIYPKTDWLSNKYYIMNVPVTRESIKFDVITVTDFESGDSFNITISK